MISNDVDINVSISKCFKLEQSEHNSCILSSPNLLPLIFSNMFVRQERYIKSNRLVSKCFLARDLKVLF